MVCLEEIHCRWREGGRPKREERGRRERETKRERCQKTDVTIGGMRNQVQRSVEHPCQQSLYNLAMTVTILYTRVRGSKGTIVTYAVFFSEWP